MAIYDELIRNAMRVRIIGAGIFSETDFQFENKNFNPSGKEIWVSESWVGGDEQIYTNIRTQIPTALVQYDIYVPENTGTLMAGQAANAIEREFAINSEKARIEVASIPETDICVYKTGMSVRSEEPWFVMSLLLYLRIIGNE